MFCIPDDSGEFVTGAWADVPQSAPTMAVTFTWAFSSFQLVGGVMTPPYDGLVN